VPIPIENLYYLLCYAWDHLEERDAVPVSAGESTSLVNLFARVLVRGVAQQIRRGLDRGYVEEENDLRRLRGRIDVSATAKRALRRAGLVACRFDELSHDVLHNQIIKSTLLRLSRAQGLDLDLERALHDLAARMGDVSDVSTVSLEPASFRRVQLHRNIQAYRFLLHVCELVAGQLLVDERTGGYRFSDFTRDEQAMARLFEAFVRNFFTHEQQVYRVSRSEIRWDAVVDDPAHLPWLPRMQTDTTLVSNEWCLVIEAKYHQRPFDRSRWGEREVVKAGHLYQVFAYLKNIAARGGCYQDAHGVLLYAAGFDARPLRFVLQGHTVDVCVLNLAQPWQGIHHDLLSFAGLRSPQKIGAAGTPS
jgi:5-methylcytosine-specific restriction enzyme subunit McrC